MDISISKHFVEEPIVKAIYEERRAHYSNIQKMHSFSIGKTVYTDKLQYQTKVFTGFLKASQRCINLI